jgi:hypothetical protein
MLRSDRVIIDQQNNFATRGVQRCILCRDYSRRWTMNGAQVKADALVHSGNRVARRRVVTLPRDDHLVGFCALDGQALQAFR